jgi:hypothetical protein
MLRSNGAGKTSPRPGSLALGLIPPRLRKSRASRLAKKRVNNGMSKEEWSITVQVDQPEYDVNGKQVAALRESLKSYLLNLSLSVGNSHVTIVEVKNN